MKYPVLFAIFLLSSCTKVETTPVNQWQHVAQGSYASEISHDGRYAAVSSVEHGVAFWDLQQNALKYQWQHTPEQENLVFSLAISPDNSHVLTADQHTFALWRTTQGKMLDSGNWTNPQYEILQYQPMAPICLLVKVMVRCNILHWQAAGAWSFWATVKKLTAWRCHQTVATPLPEVMITRHIYGTPILPRSSILSATQAG